MPKVIYVMSDQSRKEVHAENGASIMQTAVENLIEGIPGDCGGSCSCATCHCYVDPEWVDKTGVAEELEADMLDCVDERSEHSRLSCQLIMNDELDGIVVHIPDSPY